MSTLKHVAVHPLVLLSIVDHYNRVVGRSKNKRVVGVLLGTRNGDKLDCVNCYAVPFDEDPSEKDVWFFDKNYHEIMFDMFKKIHSKEKVVGWYTTSTKIKTQDIQIHESFKEYCNEPIMLQIDVDHQDILALPTEVFLSEKEITPEGAEKDTFVHISSSVEAFEAEEVGVEHLLREIKDLSLDTVQNSVAEKIKGLKGCHKKIGIIKEYLSEVLLKQKPINQDILKNLQELSYHLPNLSQEKFLHAYTAKNNDYSLMIFVSNLVKTMTVLHDLIDNKLKQKDFEQQLKTSEEKIEKKNSIKT